MSKAYKKAEKRIEEAKAEGAIKLDLSFMSLDKIPESITTLTGLKELDLRANQISDISFLTSLTGLQTLDLSYNHISDINFLTSLTGLQTLDLRANQISDVSFLTSLTGLQTLDLHVNQISDISFLTSLTGLQTLDLSYNQISDISFLTSLTGLTELNLNYNQISDISFLTSLTGLTELKFNYNQISDISFLTSLTGLQTLYLSKNQISDISFLTSLTGLQTLKFNYNQISDISFLTSLTGLQTLDLSYNQISDISFLTSLTGLQTLYLSANQISDYSFLSSLTGLKELDLRANEISDYSFLTSLTGLQTLDLSANHISDYSFLSSLTGLKELDLRANQISDVSFLTSLTGLQTLDLSENQISDISFLSSLTGLKELYLGENQITDISFLEKLSGLQSLYLRENQITDISPLYDLIQKGLSVHLQYSNEGIVLEGNPITTPPLSVVKQGREAVLNYFEQIKEQGEAPLYEAKLMILGQGGAGKTTFANLQVDRFYDLNKNKPESTLGIEVHEGVKFKHQADELEEQQISTKLWDFGGQNIQKMLHQFFITEDCLYVLVNDKRKENTDFDYWFQIINLLGSRSPVIVLENQTGAVGNNESFALNKYQRLFKGLDIDKEEVNLSKTRSGYKTRWTRLNGLIEEKLSKLEIVNRKVPAKWSIVREELTKLKGHKYISKDLFHEVCAAEPIGLTKDQADLCLLYLRALGDVVYFEDRELCTHIFLDHNWLTEGVYYILSDKGIEKSKGKFNRDQAYQKWEEKGYNEEAKAMLLRLMLRNQFDLCYVVAEDTFITPLLLPVDRPKSVKSLEANLHFRFQYGFMPHGMFSRAIVRLNEKIDGERRWKSGVLLTDQASGAKAEVQQYNDPEENQQVIDIKIKGDKKGCKLMLDFIRTNIEHLHKEFKNLKIYRKVGCNCNVCQGRMKAGDNPSFYDYEELLAKVENRRYFIDCPNDKYNPVNIGQILSEVVTEDAGEKSIDSELLYRLKEMGMSINKIINNNQANPKFDNRPHFENKPQIEVSPVITTTISVEVKVEIGSLLDEMSLLKEDINSELTIEGVPEKEIQKLVQDVEMAEKALEEVETSGEEPKRPAKTRIKRFFNDLQDEESSLHQGLQKLRKGRDYGVKLAETYNKIAGNFAMPLVPPAALEVIKRI